MGYSMYMDNRGQPTCYSINKYIPHYSYIISPHRSHQRPSVTLTLLLMKRDIQKSKIRKSLVKYLGRHEQERFHIVIHTPCSHPIIIPLMIMDLAHTMEFHETIVHIHVRTSNAFIDKTTKSFSSMSPTVVLNYSAGTLYVHLHAYFARESSTRVPQGKTPGVLLRLYFWLRNRFGIHMTPYVPICICTTHKSVETV